MAKKITTVCGDISPEQLGFTSIHEHTLISMAEMFESIDLGSDKEENARPTINLEDLTDLRVNLKWMELKETSRYDEVDTEIKELQAFREVGGQSLMDCSYNGSRLDMNYTKQIAEASGVNIIACAGYFADATYPKGFDPMDSETIKKTELTEIREGIGGTDCKAGCIKIGFVTDLFNNGVINENEMNVFRSSCEVAAETGYPVAIHPPQLRENIIKITDIAIEEYGISPQKIDICHQDGYINSKNVHSDYRTFMKDKNKVFENFVEYVKQLLDRGVYINFDCWGGFHVRERFDGDAVGAFWSIDDNQRLSALIPLLEGGYAEQIMFGHDKCGKIFNYHSGGYGFTRFPTYAVPALNAMGFEKEVKTITVDNPARFLAHD